MFLLRFQFFFGFAVFGDSCFAGVLGRWAFGFFVVTCASCLALDGEFLGTAADFRADFAVTWPSELQVDLAFSPSGQMKGGAANNPPSPTQIIQLTNAYVQHTSTLLPFSLRIISKTTEECDMTHT
jgi:hypothetical protein